MIEVEVKLHVEDPQTLEERLQEMGATFEGEERQRDIYFNAPQRDFSQTKEALRLRQIGEQSQVILTYKGSPAYSRGSKARQEIESRIDSGVENLQHHREILEALGFQTIIEINKRRRLYSLEGIPVYLDTVEGLGSFAEVGMAVPNEQVPAMKEKIIALLERLGLNREQIVKESYLGLLLAQGT